MLKHLPTQVGYDDTCDWMDYLGKGEVLTNTDLDSFVNSI